MLKGNKLFFSFKRIKSHFRYDHLNDWLKNAILMGRKKKIKKKKMPQQL